MPSQTVIKSAADLISVVDGLEKQFADSGKGFVPVWYRGQADSSWPLQPTALRDWFIQKLINDDFLLGGPNIYRLARERGINREFRRMAASMLPHGASDVDIYLLAQHAGMPTRLLDWTTNAQSALFFAVCSRPDADGALFSWKPRTFGHQPAEHHLGCYEIREPQVQDSIGTLFGENDRPGSPFIIPVMPDLVAGRMLQQGSQFTLHMPPEVGRGAEEEVNEPALEIDGAEQFIVPKDCKRAIQLQLRRLSINWATLFPDTDHVAKEIRTAWELYP